LKTLLTLTFLALCLTFTPPALAQTSGGDFRRFEFFGGFSHNRADIDPDGGAALFPPPATAPPGFLDRTGLNGFEATLTANVSRYVGVKGGVMGFYGTKSFNGGFPCRPGQPCPNPCVVALTCPDRFNRETSLHELLGGVQLKDNSTDATVKPFLHVLAGAAWRDATFYPNPDDPDPDCGPACGEFTVDRRSFVVDISGGLDVRLSRRVDLRVFQVGYNPTRFGGETQNNLRFGFGVAVH
jgi:hypothetical protein